MTRILVFGDSITYGALDKEGGWVQRLRKFLDKNFTKLDIDVYNLGISGDTPEDLLERFEFETKQRMKEGEKIIVIFSIGINDSQYIHDKNSLRTSLERFRENIKNLIKSANRFTSKIVFVGLTPVDESKTIPIPWNKNKSYKNEYIQKYNEIIKLVCKENKLYFVDIFENYMKLNYKNLLKDGLHLNSEGHEKLFEIIKDSLIKNKII